MKDFLWKILKYATFGAFSIWLWTVKFSFQLPSRAEAWFDANFDRRSQPLILRREDQIKHINENISEIKQDLRDVRNALIGPRKSKED